MKVLILGDGLLGKELKDLTGWDYVSRKKCNPFNKDTFDITNIDSFIGNLNEVFDGCAMARKYDVVVNCIACTDTYSDDRELHWNTNYKGVANLINFCNQWKMKLVHISSDYLYSGSNENAKETDVPVHCKNWYGYTKLLADGLVQLSSQNYLLIRSTHKKYPFPHNYAWKNQVGNFDYVGKIANLIASLINKGASGIYNVGTQKKTMFDLAKESNSKVKPTTEFKYESTPRNTSLDITKLTKKINE